MKVDKIIAENSLQQKKLSAENQTYYENLLLFMRGHSVLKNDIVLEMSLLEILNDLVQAQTDGISASDYYGHDPKAQAQALLDAIPNDIGGFIWFGLGLLLELIGIFTLSDLMMPGSQLDVGRLLLQAVVVVPFPFFILWLIGSHALRSTSKWKLGLNQTIYGSLAVALGLVLLLDLWHTAFVFTPQDRVVLLLASTLLIIGIGWVLMARPAMMFMVADIYLLGQLALIILFRTPGLQPIMTTKLTSSGWAWGLMGLIVLVMLGVGFKIIQRNRR